MAAKFVPQILCKDPFSLKRRTTETVAQRCSVKKVFLEISQSLHENTCARAPFLIKCRPQACSFIKKRFWHRCFPVNFVKFLRIHFLIEHLRWLLLEQIQKIFCLFLNITSIPDNKFVVILGWDISESGKLVLGFE